MHLEELAFMRGRVKARLSTGDQCEVALKIPERNGDL